MEKIVSHLKEGFPNLSSEDLELLAQHMSAQVIPQYQTLYRKADSSVAFYVIRSGRISLTDEDARPLFTLTAGNILGEHEFFRGEPYALTSRAEIETACWEMTSEAFQEVLQARPDIGVRITDGPVVQMVPYLQDKLTHVPALENVPAEVLADMAHLFKAQALLAGDHLYTQGDAAQGLFLVDRGKLERQHGTDMSVGEITPGTLLGVSQLSTDSSYDHSVMAQDQVLCWSLSRRDFQRLNSAHPILLRALTRALDSSLPPLQPADPQHVEMLGQVSTLAPLGRAIWEGMASRSQGQTVREGDMLYRMGEPSSAFFLVLSGEIELTTASATGVTQELDRVTAGGVFGLESLLIGTPRTKQAAATQETSLRVITRDELQKMGQTMPAVTHWLATAAQTEEGADRPMGRPAADLGDMSMFGLFAGLTGAELARFPQEFEVATFYPQEHIYQTGEILDRMYLLQRGTVMLAPNDQTLPRFVQPGAVLDLFALMSQTPCRETASASTDVRFITLPHAAVVRLVAEIPRFSSNLWQIANAGTVAATPAPQPPPPMVEPYGQVTDPMGQVSENPEPEPTGTRKDFILYGDPEYPYQELPPADGPASSPQPQIQAEPFLAADPFASTEEESKGTSLHTLSFGGVARAFLILLAVTWLVISFIFFADSPAQWFDFLP